MRSTRFDLKLIRQLARTVGACGLLLTLVVACSSLEPGYDTPTVTVSYVKLLPADGLALNFEIGLRVINPNETPLKLKGASCNVKLDGYDILAGVSHDMPVIDGFSEGEIRIEARASLLDSMQFVKSLTARPRDSFSYELNAKLSTNLFPAPIRIQDSGTISFQP